MSQENVEIVKRAWDAWERRDMEALFALYDPAIVWDQRRYGPFALDGLYHGHEGVRRFFGQWLEPFETYQARAEELIDAGDCVIAAVRQSGRGRGSGAEVEMPVFWQVYRVRDGVVTRIEVYELKTEALKAAGLSE